MSPKVFIIILNWNNANDTLACLASVEKLDYPNYHVLVVDNGSADDSVARIRAACPNVELLEMGENLGYAAGNNVGIRHALERGAEYIWLLNDDVVVAPDALTALVDASANPKAGFLGPMVYMREDPQRILSAGCMADNHWGFRHRGLGETDHGQYASISEVDYLSGCALLVKRQVIEAVGVLDEDFFAYGEDVEWCYRGRDAGFKALFVPQAKVWHPDTRARDADSPLVTYYISRNHLLFGKKRRLGSAFILRNLAVYLLRIATWSVRPKWWHKRRQRDALVRAVSDFLLGRFGRAEWLDKHHA